MRDVLKNLIDGLAEAWVKVGKYWRVPCKSAITQARQRLGTRVMSQLFHQLFQTVMKMPGSLAVRVAVLAHKPHFRAFRLVILIEAGTHLIFDALMCPYRMGERVRALKLLRSVTSGMLLMWDYRGDELA